MFSNILGILFAPAFVVLIHYFDFSKVVLGYLFISFIYFIHSYRHKKSLRDIVLPSVYVVALFVAYIYSSIESVKYIPLTLSVLFLFLFLDAHFNKKEMVLGFTKQFYKKELKDEEIAYLKNGDLYWVWVMLINSTIHLYVVSFCSDATWAFYSSVGWYILFFSALSVQILYGKVYGVRMHIR